MVKIDAFFSFNVHVILKKSSLNLCTYFQNINLYWAPNINDNSK